MLTGKVSDPYQGDGFNDVSNTPPPKFDKPQTTESDDDLPF